MVLRRERRSVKEKPEMSLVLKVYTHPGIWRSSLFFKDSPRNILFGLFDS
jgi:hypothetical protein